MSSTAARFQRGSWSISPRIYRQIIVPLRHLHTNVQPKCITSMDSCFNARHSSSNSVSASKTLKPRSHCPGVRPGEGILFSGNATDQTQFGAKSDHGLSRLCYGLRRYILGVAPRRYDVSRCVPISHGSAPGIGDRAPLFAGVSTASHGSRTAMPWCYMVACK